MLNSLILRNFTVFSEAAFFFGKNLNIIIGENGYGKSHVLKAAYSAIAVSAKGERESGSAIPTKTYLQGALARKLIGVFKPDELGRLAKRKMGKNRCELLLSFEQKELDIGCSMNSTSKTEVTVENCPLKWVEHYPVFLPTREMLTIYPGFVSFYENTDLPFEETWRDICILLGAPLAKGPRQKKIKELLLPLEKSMGGDIILDKSGRFYLNTGWGNMEIHLVAEGLCKLAMLARLIATGSLLDKGYLFWDEPEANLNPAIIKEIAKTIVQISSNGIQVFIATHSLFLMREIYILQQNQEHGFDARYFGLHKTQEAMIVQQSDSMDEVGDIRALDEDIAQSERYLNQEDSHA
jgi:predicted ATPase